MNRLPDISTIRQRLRYLRGRYGEHARIAERAGISYRTLSRVMNDNHSPSYDTVKRSVDALEDDGA